MLSFIVGGVPPATQGENRQYQIKTHQKRNQFFVGDDKTIIIKTLVIIIHTKIQSNKFASLKTG